MFLFRVTFYRTTLLRTGLDSEAAAFLKKVAYEDSLTYL